MSEEKTITTVDELTAFLDEGVAKLNAGGAQSILLVSDAAIEAMLLPLEDWNAMERWPNLNRLIFGSRGDLGFLVSDQRLRPDHRIAVHIRFRHTFNRIFD